MAHKVYKITEFENEGIPPIVDFLLALGPCIYIGTMKGDVTPTVVVKHILKYGKSVKVSCPFKLVIFCFLLT